MKSRVPNVEPPINKAVAASRIPRQPFYNNLFISVLFSGAFPFGIIFVEMLFLFKSLWVEKVSYYYMYGFLTFTTFLLFIVILEISIITTYLRLNAGNFYNWQWKAFLNSFCSILLYLFMYTIYYLFFHMKLVDVVSVLLYLIYASLLNLLISVACGAIGLLTSTWFVYTMYSSVKKD
ncbi:unnamed protein product [Ambrosiozyma monospora]|uniref:Unnamed protein product n=1 Tax=Ambrosiozyma monospora TaxID=43982 RepID=A0ACB5UC55_AMBMO|nr:unnamed protein product [Ambrosiozyma monospora]